MRPSTAGWVRGYRVFFALLALLAVVVQCRQSIESGFPPSNFLSFFTIQSNLFAIAVLLWAALWTPSESWDLIRGAAVLYLSITGVVYGVLLAGYQEELQTTIPWVDTVLHKVMPLVMVADWIIDPPAAPLTFRRAIVWLLYPLAYVAYSLLRGPLVKWYPYPFLDPAQPGGYATVAVYGVGIFLAAMLFTWLVVIIGRHLRLLVT